MGKLSDSDIREFRSRLMAGSGMLGIKISEKQADQMTACLKELVLWNSKINLTAIRDPIMMAEKHLSIQLLLCRFCGKIFF
jgi:16S rRNA (guanine527-N7)-methyltransferase